MKIVVDAMGGDNAPGEIVAGVVQALKEFDSVEIALVGIEDQLEHLLEGCHAERERIEVIHAPEVVEMHDPATTPLRKKRQSSISLGVNLLKDPQYNAFISAGNTGAVVAASTIFLGMLEGVERPAIGTVLPTLKGFSFMMDAGANTDPKPQHLVQSALMAKVYARDVLGIKKPTVGLLNVGEEDSKGTDFVKDIHRMLSEKMPENFIGNVEGSGIFRGDSDCIICDGFVGNVVLKVSESLAESARKLIKEEIFKSPLAMLGALLLRPSLKKIKQRADYSEYGGAPLLGVNGIVMICHGRSNAKAIKNAIRAACREVDHNILEKMKKEMQ
jgi:glycerol-3-phosphate acyltransferase PlsX